MIPHSSSHGRFYETALLALCAILLIWQLFIPPTLGVGDTSDSKKLIARYCLGPQHPEENQYFDYVTFHFSYRASECWNSELFTSAVIPLRIGLLISRVFLPSGNFDVRILGAIYAALFFGAFAGLLCVARWLSPPARWMLPACALVIFGGASYVPWFNSFYFDTASLAFLLLSVVALSGLAVVPAVSTPRYLMTTLCVVLFATSKAQHAPLALAAIPNLWLASGRVASPRLWLRLLATAAIVAGVAVPLFTAPYWYSTTNVYNALFYKSLPRSANPAGDLAEFGLDKSMMVYVGHHAFEPSTGLSDPRQTEILSHKLTPVRLAEYYVSHPRVAWLRLLEAMNDGSRQRVRMTIGSREYRLGNYALSTGRPPGAQSHFFDLWTQAKSAVFGGRPRLYLLYAAAVFATLWILAARGPMRVLLASLTSMAAGAAVLAMFDGVDDGRHLFLFNALLDIAACVLVATVSARFARRSIPGDAVSPRTNAPPQ